MIDVTEHFGLARKLARRYEHFAAKYCGYAVEFDDLFQAACIALLSAARSFRPDAGYRFSTYAWFAIRNAMYRELHQARRLARSGATRHALLSDPADYSVSDDDVNEREALVAELLAELPEHERVVIRARYLEPERPTLAAVGQRYGVTKQRVEQLQARALRRMRRHVEAAVHE